MSTQLLTVEELAFREADGISVSLWWVRETNQVRILVEDEKYEHSFELEVAAGENPMDVFRHPFAYAPDPWSEQPASSIY